MNDVKFKEVKTTISTTEERDQSETSVGYVFEQSAWHGQARLNDIIRQKTCVAMPAATVTAVAGMMIFLQRRERKDIMRRS